MRFAEDLKAVANADHQTARAGVGRHRFHRGREPRNRARAQVVAVAEATGYHDALHVAERVFFVPDVAHRLAENLAQHVVGVLVAVAAGELEDAKLHRIVIS